MLVSRRYKNFIANRAEARNKEKHNGQPALTHVSWFSKPLPPSSGMEFRHWAFVKFESTIISLANFTRVHKQSQSHGIVQTIENTEMEQKNKKN